MSLVTGARYELAGMAAASRLPHRGTQTYHIVFTRALKEIYIGVPDAEARAHLASAIA